MFCPQGHYLNKLGRGSLDYYQGSRRNGFRQEAFLCFSYISPCKTCDHQDGASFGPKMGN